MPQVGADADVENVTPGPESPIKTISVVEKAFRVLLPEINESTSVPEMAAKMRDGALLPGFLSVCAIIGTACSIQYAGNVGLDKYFQVTVDRAVPVVNGTNPYVDTWAVASEVVSRWQPTLFVTINWAVLTAYLLYNFWWTDSSNVYRVKTTENPHWWCTYAVLIGLQSAFFLTLNGQTNLLVLIFACCSAISLASSLHQADFYTHAISTSNEKAKQYSNDPNITYVSRQIAVSWLAIFIPVIVTMAFNRSALPHWTWGLTIGWLLFNLLSGAAHLNYINGPVQKMAQLMGNFVRIQVLYPCIEVVILAAITAVTYAFISKIPAPVYA
jgi:hypothetical protein